MNWIQSLYETYEQCQSSIGYSSDSKTRPLLPVCHVTAQAHIEVVIDGKGNYRRAELVDKLDSTTIIPTTEKSAGRTGQKPESHPLCDKLQYVAGDFHVFGGSVTSGFSKDPQEPYRTLVAILSKWCDSEFSHPKARAILEYLKKGSLISDLVKSQILILGSDGTFIQKKDKPLAKNGKDIFSLIESQDDAFVRWVVETPDSREHRVWRDKTLWDSWSSYYLNSCSTESLCMVTGAKQTTTTNHPKYVLREGDGRKLISANDDKGFTYRGRFTDDHQACSVGLETSQKAHYALTWLISRQGYVDDNMAVVAWAISGADVPQPTDDSWNLIYGELDSADESPNVDTAELVANQLKKRIAGYGKKIDEAEKVVIMAVDSATPGRLSIIYYRLLVGSDFLHRIDDWHETCAWLHGYRYIEGKDERGKPTRRRTWFWGAPAPADIAEAAYATNRNGKFDLDGNLRRSTIKRLLPCIIDGQPIPRDLVEIVVRRASNRVGLEPWQWEKTLSIACALYRKHKSGKEKFDMALDETRNTRDYLYGRLLAIADVLEERALTGAEKNRPTNAVRYMQQFSQRPFRTWKQIHDLLTPYLMRLGTKAAYYKNLIGQVEDLFSPEDFVSNKPLLGEYLLGYYCQRQKLWEKKAIPASDVVDANEEN